MITDNVLSCVSTLHLHFCRPIQYGVAIESSALSRAPKFGSAIAVMVDRKHTRAKSDTLPTDAGWLTLRVGFFLSFNSQASQCSTREGGIAEYKMAGPKTDLPYKPSDLTAGCGPPRRGNPPERWATRASIFHRLPFLLNCRRYLWWSSRLCRPMIFANRSAFFS